jgi:hypothetical protein
MNITQTLSADSRALATLFAEAPVGGTVTYAAMSDAIGRSITPRRYLALRALQIVNRETGAIFGSVRGVGYQRLAATDAHMLGAHARGRIRRTAKRTASAIQSAIDTANDMPDEAKRRAYAEINALSLIRHLSRDKPVAAATPEPKAEPVAITMRRFAESIGATE